MKAYLTLTYVVIALLIQALGPSAFADTQYYTMVKPTLERRECRMEGNQIIDGQLYGSNCRPYTKHNYPWGVGNHDNPIIPCVHAAGPYRRGSWQPVRGSTCPNHGNKRGFECPWGPLKGRCITQMQVADSGPGHLDQFVGLCAQKKMVYSKKRRRWIQTDICERFAPEGTMASNGGNREQAIQVAAAIVNAYYPGVGTQYAEMLRTGNTAVASAPADLPSRPGAPASQTRPAQVSAPATQTASGANSFFADELPVTR